MPPLKFVSTKRERASSSCTATGAIAHLADEEEGATFRTFPDLKSLVASPRALETFWVVGQDGQDGDRPELNQQLLRQVAEALGEPLVYSN